LLSYLKAEDLAMSVYAGGGSFLKGVDSAFEVEVVLTNRGLQNYNMVLEAIFKYA
jgi:secreted Zn-dependent insulinase-like peptidase